MFDNVFDVFGLDGLDLLFSVVLNLLDGVLIPLDCLVDVLLLLVDLRLLVLHLFAVLLLLKVDVGLVLLDDLLKGTLKVLPFLLFMGLALLESGGIFEHLG